MILPCIVCEKELQNVDITAENQPYEGLAFTSHGHYGGTVFDPMDGRYLEINVCDECLVKAANKQQVLLGQDYKLVTIPGPKELHEMPSVVATTPIKRALVFWNPEIEEKDDTVHFSSWEEIEEARKLGFTINSRFTDQDLKNMF